MFVIIRHRDLCFVYSWDADNFPDHDNAHKGRFYAFDSRQTNATRFRTRGEAHAVIAHLEKVFAPTDEYTVVPTNG